MQVHQILKAKPHGEVVTITPGMTVSEAAALLSSKRIGAVVVSADGEVPLGILSERDIVRELGRRGTGCLSESVEMLMTREPVSCARGDDALVLLQRMTEGRFRHMPVMEEGRMTGIISIGDLVKARLEELAAENDALQGMIMGH
jgi:CBS domain-containing protein